MLITGLRLKHLLPLASLVLTACVTNSPTGPGKSPDSPEWRQHQQAVQKITQYQTRGAFAYLADDRKIYARFNWQQTNPERYRLLLTNPLGSTELELNVLPDQVQLTTGNGDRYTTKDAEQTLARLSGMPIPLNSLRQWILGLPGEATDYRLDDKYQLKELSYQQNGKTWKVVYSSYDNNINPALPSNMELSTGTLRIKLKMDNWKVGP